jgi:predicted O-methyltransferase YrrM
MERQMHHIRPYQLLGIPDAYADEIRFFMPQAQGAGSLHTIESVLLVKLLRIVEPRLVFEFGTYKGLTTRLLLANLPPIPGMEAPRILTLDLPTLEDVEFQGTDIDLAREVLGSERAYQREREAHLVHQLLQDSMRLDPTPWSGQVQYIFIDANHALPYVRQDTENAFAMLSPGRGVVIWHDYGHPEFPELTAYLEELARTRPLFHVEGTKLVFQPQGFDVRPRNA